MPNGSHFRFDEGIRIKGQGLFVDILRIEDRRVFDIAKSAGRLLVVAEAVAGQPIPDNPSVFARHPFAGTAEADDDVAESPVVEVDDAAPEDAARVDAEGVALLQMIVDQRGEEVVRRRDGVKIAGRLMSPAGTTIDLPPPVAPPFRPKVGPSDGSRSASATLSPFFAMPCARPIEIVVLPSPAEVGVSAVTRMTLPGARRASATGCGGGLAR